MSVCSSDPGRRATVCKAMSCGRWTGYADLYGTAVVNHGVDESLAEKLFQLNKDFFALPIEEKLKIAVNKDVRGYTPMDVRPAY